MIRSREWLPASSFDQLSNQSSHAFIGPIIPLGFSARRLWRREICSTAMCHDSSLAINQNRTGCSMHTPTGNLRILSKDIDHGFRSFGSVIDASGKVVNSNATPAATP
jgi:hypothetical protein